MFSHNRLGLFVKHRRKFLFFRPKARATNQVIPAERILAKQCQVGWVVKVAPELDGIAVQVFARSIAHLIFVKSVESLFDIPNSSRFSLRQGESKQYRKPTDRRTVGLTVFIPPVVWENNDLDTRKIGMRTRGNFSAPFLSAATIRRNMHLQPTCCPAASVTPPQTDAASVSTSLSAGTG